MRLSPQARAAGLAFLTAAATLLLQVLVHRMVSAKLLNNYAFLMISLTMLGFACSGVILSRWLTPFLRNRDEVLASCAALFVLSVIGASVTFYHASFEPFSRGGDPLDPLLAFLRVMPYALVYAMPFIFLGLILGLLLSSPDLSTRTIYCFDLIGSAAGALGAIPAIKYLGVETSTLAACAVMLVGALLLASPRRPWPRILAAVAALTLIFSIATKEQLFKMLYPQETMLAEIERLGSPFGVEHIAWDPVARIEVSRIPPPASKVFTYPSLIGSNRNFHARFKRMLTQNNYAFTFAVDYDGTKDSLKGIEETIYSAAYVATSVPHPQVLTIGVGGGFDVLTALAFDASAITGVEINAATVKILRQTYHDYFHKWVDDPRVRLVLADGRHFIATTDKRFDVIQLSGVDSYSGTPAAAYVFSENYLYTAEAFDLYLSHLTDGGILNMMRLEYTPPREMLRALVTAVAALRRAGMAQPADHIMMLTAKEGNFTALLVKKTPFTAAEQQRLAAWAGRSQHFSLSAGPGLNTARANHYQRFLSLGDSHSEAAAVATAPFDIAPVEDDRPFFFKYSFWWHLWSNEPVIRASTPVMEYSVLLLLGTLSLATLICVYLPLRFLVAPGTRRLGTWKYGVFFAGTGVGYLAIEIALLQKFGLFLGHPNYALSVVLAALLLSTGLGSLCSRVVVQKAGGLRFLAYLLAVVILVEYGMLFPRLPSLLGLSFWVRTAIVFALVAPIGIVLGTFVPSALEQLKLRAAAFVPWAWGINGIFSVLAPVLSVAISMTWGINALLLAAIPVYLVVGFSFPGPGEQA